MVPGRPELGGPILGDPQIKVLGEYFLNSRTMLRRFSVRPGQLSFWLAVKP